MCNSRRRHRERPVSAAFLAFSNAPRIGNKPALRRRRTWRARSPRSQCARRPTASSCRRRWRQWWGIRTAASGGLYLLSGPRG